MYSPEADDRPLVEKAAARVVVKEVVVTEAVVTEAARVVVAMVVVMGEEVRVVVRAAVMETGNLHRAAGGSGLPSRG